MPHWICCLVLLCVGCLPASYQDEGSQKIVRSVSEEIRQEFQLDDFYQLHVDVGGFPVVSSDRVYEEALLEARYLILKMVGHRPEILKAMASSKTRFTVMAHDEWTTDVPEHSDLRPPEYWDRRARGLGATRWRPCVSCGEENLLGFEGDPYAKENILIHEFAHAIHEMGLVTLDPTFDDRLDQTYRAAMEKGLWAGVYAATNRMEYWAEAVQSWFGTNRENDPQHNHVNTRDELRAYDPAVAALCHEVFGDGDWRYVHPGSRQMQGHLSTLQGRSLPTFSWAEGMQEAYEANPRPE
ncbi:hypothetical protein CBD41_03805 [bacterium TMED181]|nr:hypothetical protein [Planctomycetota bacterium]OUW45551.1 MAG: hypothetical protein CBD41_03805 [bacterium TMED181]